MTPLEQGAALLAGGRFHEALAVLGRGLQQQPASVELRLALARACNGAGDALTATAWLSDACRVAPGQPETLGLLAAQLMEQRLYAQALPLYEGLHAQGDRSRATLLHLGFCLEMTGAVEAAAVRYREAIAQEPDFLEAHVDLAGVLWRIGEHEAGLAHALRAAEIAPTHPHAVRIVGTAFMHLNRLPEAEAWLRRALELQPGFMLAEVDLALTLLLAGRLSEAWPLYARRWADTARLPRPAYHNPALEWRGPREQPPRGLRLLVYGEQGRGDEIHFIRYAERLVADGATVYADVMAELVPLIRRMPGVICLTAETPSVEIDHHVALMDLPMHYGTTLESIPARVPYLGADPSQAARWRERLKPWDGVLKVGVAWAGQPAQVNDLNRSTPLSELLSLLRMKGVQCFSLQKFGASRWTDCDPSEGSLVDFTGEWADFGDSAAMIENLDLVVSVCTAVPHLAGALGKPAWVMLPPNPDWRWMLEREDTPWYPTLRLFRRDFGEARAAQVQRLCKAVRQEREHLLGLRQGQLV